MSYQDAYHSYDDDGGYGPPRPRRRRHTGPPSGGTSVFVLGLLGLLFCGVLGCFAWLQGNEHLARSQAMRVRPDGLAVAGRIMGIISTLVLFFQIGAVVLILGAGGVSAM